MTPELLTVKQAGELLGISEAKAHQLATMGVLPTFTTKYRRGRLISRADLLALIESWKNESTASNATTTATPVSAGCRGLARRRTK